MTDGYTVTEAPTEEVEAPKALLTEDGLKALFAGTKVAKKAQATINERLVDIVEPLLARQIQGFQNDVSGVIDAYNGHGRTCRRNLVRNGIHAFQLEEIQAQCVCRSAQPKKVLGIRKAAAIRETKIANALRRNELREKIRNLERELGEESSPVVNSSSEKKLRSRIAELRILEKTRELPDTVVDDLDAAMAAIAAAEFEEIELQEAA